MPHDDIMCTKYCNMHGYSTRLSTGRRFHEPPKIVRTSAMIPVILTRDGRRSARNMCMSSHSDRYMFHFTVSSDGDITHVLTSPRGTEWKFTGGAPYPEFVAFD